MASKGGGAGAGGRRRSVPERRSRAGGTPQGVLVCVARELQRRCPTWHCTSATKPSPRGQGMGPPLYCIPSAYQQHVRPRPSPLFHATLPRPQHRGSPSGAPPHLGGQHLAQLHAPLVKAVDVPDEALRQRWWIAKGAMQRPAGGRRMRRRHDAATAAASRPSAAPASPRTRATATCVAGEGEAHPSQGRRVQAHRVGSAAVTALPAPLAAPLPTQRHHTHGHVRWQRAPAQRRGARRLLAAGRRCRPCSWAA